MPKPIGPVGPVAAVIGPTGSVNAGKWTATFDPHTIGVSLATFECYRIVIANGPAGSSFNIFIGTNQWDSVFPGDTNSWDPNVAMPLQQSQTVYFYWNTGQGTAPNVTMWFREASIL